MPIRIQCPHCEATLNVSDKMAGKRGKCPKCAAPIAVPAGKSNAPGVAASQATAAPSSAAPSSAAQSSAASGGGSGWGQNVRSPLDELLDEAGVKGVSTGPTCPSCHADVKPDAVICIECGYNFAVGKQLRTQVGIDDEEDAELAGLSESEKMLRKAERSLETEPTQFDDGKHGDGADSFVVVIGMLIVAAILIGLGIGVIFLMDQVITDSSTSVVISLVACSIFQSVGSIWLLIVAFKEKTLEGILCLCVPFYIFFFGFTRFGGLWIPTLMLTAGTVGGLASFIALQFMGGGGV